MTENTKDTPKLTPSEIADFCARIAYDRKGADIIKMDMTDLSAVADFFVICTGTSAPHIRAISERIQRDAREQHGIRARLNGTPESGWMIVDFGNVMVHVFTEEMRDTYQLETLWGDAPKIESIKILEEKARASRLIQ